MKISVITDELSSDLDTALELAVELGFEGVELRGIGEERYPRVGNLMKTRVPELIREYLLPVVSISSGLFKIPYPQPVGEEDRALRWDDAASSNQERVASELLRVHRDELLPATIQAALTLGCPLINAFTFDRGQVPISAPIPESVIDALRYAARLAATNGLIFSLENEFTCWAATSELAAQLVERLGEPNVGITWDPANAFRAGEDRAFPDGYARVRNAVRHVHFKNARINPTTGQRQFSSAGLVDWPGQIDALVSDRYSGFISVETHQRPKLATTRHYLDSLRSLMDSSVGARGNR